MYKIWSRDPFIGSFNITTVKSSYKRTIHRRDIVISLHDLLVFDLNTLTYEHKINFNY